jgi:membrane fusion protein (multidrug efflux system)
MSETSPQPSNQSAAAASVAAAANPSNPPLSGKTINWRVLIIVSVIALVAIGVGARMWWRSHNFVETDNAYLAGHVHPVSSRIAGTVTRVWVEENQTVKAGDVLAELDPADQRIRAEQIAAQIVVAQSQVAQAGAQIATARAQVGTVQAQVAQSAAQLLRATQDAQRFGELYTSDMKAVSKAEVDSANTTVSAAKADLAARRDAVAAAQAQVAAAGAAREVALAQIKVLQVQLKDAEQQIGYDRIVAPVAGRIGKRALEVGARVQSGQQLLAIVEDQVWLTANFKETQLAQLAAGQVAKVMIDAMPGQELEGKIDSFSPASGNQFALLPADNATGNFTRIVQRVPVKITLPLDKIRAWHLVPGMSAQVEIKLGQSVGGKTVAAAAHGPTAR